MKKATSWFGSLVSLCFRCGKANIPRTMKEMEGSMHQSRTCSSENHVGHLPYSVKIVDTGCMRGKR